MRLGLLLQNFRFGSCGCGIKVILVVLCVMSEEWSWTVVESRPQDHFSQGVGLSPNIEILHSKGVLVSPSGSGNCL